MLSEHTDNNDHAVIRRAPRFQIVIWFSPKGFVITGDGNTPISCRQTIECPIALYGAATRKTLFLNNSNNLVVISSTGGTEISTFVVLLCNNRPYNELKYLK
jgi:hypothetical protein